MLISSARTLVLCAVVACTAQIAVSAQTPTAISPGMQVVDPSGTSVGTVTRVKGGDITVKTDEHEVILPATSFTPSEGKLLFALTQAQLNAETEQAMAEANAKLVSGISVYGQAGTPAGTLESIDDTSVTLKLSSGQLVRMPRNSIGPSAKGAVLGISAAELQRLSEQAH
jgi:preprotein translocase subunit YajC